EAFLCVKASISALWIISDSMAPAASVVKSSLKGKLCPPWARHTIHAASSVPPA
ncbi:hypothetical protein M9458_024983, partial [Cirrhinus mrigala]